MKLDLVQIIALIVGAVLLILVGILAYQGKEYRKTIAAHEASLALYEEAQETNLDTIGKYKAENARWAEACKADPAATARALAEMTAERDRLQSDLAEATRQREVIYVRDPVAREWGNAGMPAAVADQLFGKAGSR